MSFGLALLAVAIELLVGYPDRLLRAIGHPVIWIGNLISMLDRALNADIGKDSKTPVFVEPPPEPANSISGEPPPHPSPSPRRVFPTWATQNGAEHGNTRVRCGGGSRAKRDGRGQPPMRLRPQPLDRDGFTFNRSRSLSLCFVA